jgi:hypothetical protein
VGEDRVHDTGVVHGGDETQTTATARAGVALGGVRISGHRAAVANDL